MNSVILQDREYHWFNGEIKNQQFSQGKTNFYHMFMYFGEINRSLGDDLIN